MKRLIGNKITRRLIAILICLSLAPLSACFDLGEFEGGNGDYKDYDESFGVVTGLFDGGSHDYDVDDSLFNDYVVENMDWEDEDDAVKSEEYAYIVIPFEKQLKVESLALFVWGESVATLSVNAFYFESEAEFPKKIKYKTSPETEIVVVKDVNGNDVEQEVEIEYDDPPEEVSVAETTCDVYNDEWSSFLLSDFMQEGYLDGLLHTGEDGALYIRFDVNSGLYKDKSACSFRFICLLVRAV